MRALVVYESMFGNTHAVAEHVAEGIDDVIEATVVGVHDATAEQLAAAGLVVVGGPTHVHGMSSERSRAGAADIAERTTTSNSIPTHTARVCATGSTRLADDVGDGRRAAAFDTRVHGSTLLTGQASKGIAKRLRSHGFELAVDGESFFVDKSNHLEPGEVDRATAWGQTRGAKPLRRAAARLIATTTEATIGRSVHSRSMRYSGANATRHSGNGNPISMNARMPEVHQPSRDHPGGAASPAEQRDRRGEFDENRHCSDEWPDVRPGARPTRRAATATRRAGRGEPQRRRRGCAACRPATHSSPP